jgi:hypothetical protein
MKQGCIHCVELLEMALATASALGYRIREDALGGPSGGACQLKGQKWLFIDPTLSSRERLQLVVDALAADPLTSTVEVPPALTNVIGSRRAA